MRPTVEQQMRRISERAAEVFPEDEMRRKVEKSIASGKPLRVKLGVDPTAPDIHLGNAVPLWKLRTFQDMGHVAVLIIGDYTAQVGDPSGRNALRPMLTKDDVEAFAATYLDQVGRILLPERLEIRRNSEWLGAMDFMAVLRLVGRVTVSQMLERDDFHKRFESETPIGLHEFLYPLMQAWDSVVVKADVELGGTDQRFNLLMGRDLQRAENQEPQALVINPLIAGADGSKKMSKSTGNYVGITESPDQQFGKTMSIPDSLAWDWMTYMTDLDPERITILLDQEQTHPRDAKEELAKAVVTRYWGADAAESAAAEFRSVFSEGAVPKDLPTVTVPRGAMTLAKLLEHCMPERSKSAQRRLVEQGGVSIEGVKHADPMAQVDPADGAVVKLGKLHFVRVRRG